MRSTRTLCRIAALAFAAALILTSGARAALVANESFNTYPIGELDGLNGGSGWAGGWSVFPGYDLEDVVDPTGIAPNNAPLISTSTGVPFDGNGRAVQVRGNKPLNGNSIQRQLASPFAGDDLYVSFLWRPEQDLVTDDFFILWLDDDPATNVDDKHDDDDVAFLGARGANQVFARLSNTSGTSTNQDTGANVVGANQDSLIVGRLYKDGGSSDYNRFSFWVDPTSPALGAPLKTVSRSTGMNQVSYVGLRTGQRTEDTDMFLFDQLRLGTTPADVVAQVIAGDDFDLPTGSLAGHTGGWGFGANHPWVTKGNPQVVEPTTPLSHAYIDGGDRAVASNGSGTDYKNRFSRQLAGSLPDDFYFSLLGRYDDLDSNDFFTIWLDSNGNLASNNHSTNVPNIGIKGGQFFARFDVSKEVYLGTASDGEDFLLVGHIYKDGSSAYNTFEAWLNPIAPGSPDVLLTGTGPGSLSFIGLRMGANSEAADILYVDRIRFGPTLESVGVVPEPATVSLLVFGGIGLVARRRRS